MNNSVEDFLDFSKPGNIYMLFSIARSKNNSGVTAKHQIVHREPARTLNEFRNALTRLRAISELDPEHKYYIYVSANARNVIKAYANLKKLQADFDTSAMFGKFDHMEQLARMHKVWYSALMQPDARGTKYFLIDIDSDDQECLDKVRNIVSSFKFKDYNAEVLLEQKTRNGWHFMTTPFDPRILDNIPDVEVKKDSLLYLECVNF